MNGPLNEKDVLDVCSNGRVVREVTLRISGRFQGRKYNLSRPVFYLGLALYYYYILGPEKMINYCPWMPKIEILTAWVMSVGRYLGGHAITGFNLGVLGLAENPALRPGFFRQNTSGYALGVLTLKSSPSGWVCSQAQHPMIKNYTIIHSLIILSMQILNSVTF